MPILRPLARQTDMTRGDHLFHSGIPFIKNGRDDLAVAAHAEDQLV